MLREQHKEATRKYYECKNVEKALQRHIQDAIEDKYLETLVNEDTQLIQADIPTVLAYLFETYGTVPSAEVKEKENEIRSMTFHPADPMILLYNPIKKLAKMAVAAGIQYTQDQVLDMGLTVIKNTRDFERALGDWEAKPAADKNWINFKLHFNEAQKQLKAIRGPTMQQAGYHQLNMLAHQFRSELEERDNDLLTVLKSMDTATTAPSQQSQTAVSTITPVTHQANATSTDVQMEMIALLRKIEANLSTCPPTNTRTTTRPKKGRKTPDNATFPRNNTSKYCWTHGGCGHESQTCEAKATGHKDEATFSNRMGGSNTYCT